MTIARTYLVSCILLLTLAPNLQLQAATKPNIIFILADDLGYTDLSTYGSKYHETPQLDRLAKEGMKFTDGYSCGPNCQPTRAAIMSGQYGPRTGIYTVGHIDRFAWQTRPLRPVDNVTALPKDKVTIAQTLQKAGYVTAIFGKWHLGQATDEHPLRRGFDEAITSSGKHFNFNTTPKIQYPEGTYLADFLTELAVDFIKRHSEQPFFLYLPHYGVHSPYQAKKEWITHFKNKSVPADSAHRDPVYAAMLASVDESVGKILATLDQLNLAENTLVIFSSDNGGVGGYQREGIQARDVTDNAPLRGGKGTLYEGGIRVPWIFRWKGTISPSITTSYPINSVDLYPTLIEIASAPKPENQPLDGHSYASLFQTKFDPDTNLQALSRSPLYWHFPGYLGSSKNTWRTTPVSVIRDGDWKLLKYHEDQRSELYQLSQDLGEQHNLVSKLPGKAHEMEKKLQDWLTELNAPFPTPNANPQNPASYKSNKQKNQAAGHKDSRKF